MSQVAEVVPGFVPPAPSRTPRLLRWLQVLSVVALLLAGLLGTLLVTNLRTDLGSVIGLAEQYARLGRVESLVLDARNVTALAILHAPGPDISELHIAAGQRLGEANGLLVQAGQARPQDSSYLSDFSERLSLLQSDLWSSAALDRQRAIDKLSAADQRVNTTVQPGLDSLLSTLVTESRSTPWGDAGFIVPLLGAVVIAVLVWASWRVAVTSHRVLNHGLVAAGIACLLLVWTLLSAQQIAREAAQASRVDAFGQEVALTEAETNAHKALRVLLDAALAHKWSDEAAATYRANLQPMTNAHRDSEAPDPSAFTRAGDDLIELMKKGSWTEAESLLVGTKGGPNVALVQYTEQIHERTASALTDAAAGPRAAQGSLLTLLVVAILLSLGGATAAYLGVERRLREYR